MQHTDLLELWTIFHPVWRQPCGLCPRPDVKQASSKEHDQEFAGKPLPGWPPPPESLHVKHRSSCLFWCCVRRCWWHETATYFAMLTHTIIRQAVAMLGQSFFPSRSFFNMRAVSHAYRDADDIRAEFPLFFVHPNTMIRKEMVPQPCPKRCRRASMQRSLCFLRFHTSSWSMLFLNLEALGAGMVQPKLFRTFVSGLGLEFYRDSCEQFSEKHPTTSTAVVILNLRAATASNNFTPILFDRASPWPPHHVASSMLSHQLTIP